MDMYDQNWLGDQRTKHFTLMRIIIAIFWRCSLSVLSFSFSFVFDSFVSICGSAVDLDDLDDLEDLDDLDDFPNEDTRPELIRYV